MINFSDYKNKVSGCWWGKYAGGVMGMPFECYRGTIDIDWYTQKNLHGIDNDDIDLQLVWLRVAEKFGNRINSQILAEYWLTYITANMSEYGACKTNLRAGIAPPLSGSFCNPNKNSCGAFIRSEIWACLCAGNPDIAVRYALEDSSVDHSDEGVYGEVFFSALQAEAFVQDDIEKLIIKALSYIPNTCAVAKSVLCALSCYKNKKSWKTTRKEILQTVPSNFGLMCGYYKEEEKDIPRGENGFDAPSNVGLAVMALLYGEKDFLKTICIAAGCMEDSDCTAGNAGSTLGIILGYNNIPKRVLEPLENKITIGSIKNDTDLCKPGSITELVERILSLTPTFLGGKIVNLLNEKDGYSIREHVSGPDFLRFIAVDQYGAPDFTKLLERIPNGTKFDNVLFDTQVFYDKDCCISLNQTKKFILKFWNRMYDQQWLRIKWFTPNGITVKGGNYTTLFLDQKHGGDFYSDKFNVAEITFELEMTEPITDDLDIFIEISSVGRYTRTFIPITLMKK